MLFLLSYPVESDALSIIHAVLLHQKLWMRSDHLSFSDDGNNKSYDVPEQGCNRNGYGCGSKGLGNADSVADRGNIACVKRCIIGQRKDQIAVIVNASALDSDAVFTVSTVLTVFSVCADDLAEVGNNPVGKGDDKIAVCVNMR